jgi:RNA polymerase primary sigma factor
VPTSGCVGGIERALRALLRQLPEREHTVLQLRYDLIDGHARTLKEVSGRMGLTRERVRQLECTGLERLRAICDQAGLEEYLSA